MDDLSATEVRVRATSILHGALLEAIFSEILSKYDEPIEEAKAFASAARSAIDRAIADVAARDGAAVRAFAMDELQEMWVRIIEDLEESGRPGTIRLPGTE